MPVYAVRVRSAHGEGEHHAGYFDGEEKDIREWFSLSSGYPTSEDITSIDPVEPRKITPAAVSALRTALQKMRVAEDAVKDAERGAD